MSTRNFRPNILYNEISKPIINLRGSVTQNEKIDDEGNRVRMCHICGLRVTHRWSSNLFGSPYEPVSTKCSHNGSYTVYKGFCLRQTCYTIAGAQQMLGEGVDVTNKEGPTPCPSGDIKSKGGNRKVDVDNDVLKPPAPPQRKINNRLSNDHNKPPPTMPLAGTKVAPLPSLPPAVHNEDLPAIGCKQDPAPAVTAAAAPAMALATPIIATPLTLKDGDIVEFLVKLENRHHHTELVLNALVELEAYIREQNEINPRIAYLPGDRWFKVLRLVMDDHIQNSSIILKCLAIITKLCAFQSFQQQHMIKHGLVPMVLSIIENHPGEENVQLSSLFLLECLCSDEKNGINAETTSISKAIRCMIESMRVCQGKAQQCAVRGLYKLSLQKKYANPLTKKCLNWEIREGLRKHWVGLVLDDMIKHHPERRNELERLYKLRKSKVKEPPRSSLTNKPNRPSPSDIDTKEQPKPNSLGLAPPNPPVYTSNPGDDGKKGKEGVSNVLMTPPEQATSPSSSSSSSPPPPPPPPPPAGSNNEKYSIPSKETSKLSDGRSCPSSPVTSRSHDWAQDGKQEARQHAITHQMKYFFNESDLSTLNQFLFESDPDASVVKQGAQLIVTLIESKVNCSSLRSLLGQNLGNLLAIHIMDEGVMVPLVGLIVRLCESDGFYCLKIRNSFCVGLLLQAMREHSNSLPILGGCCSILWLFSEIEHGRRVIGNEGGCETIISSLIRHIQSPRLQQEGLACLRNLARERSNQEHIQNRGGENLVFNNIQVHIGSPGVIETALLSLNDFVVSADGGGDVCPIYDETLQAVFFAMIDNPDNERLQKSACTLLKAILYNPSNLRLMQVNRDGLVGALEVATNFPSCERDANRIMQRMGN